MSKSSITLTVNSGPKQGESLTRNSKSKVRIGRVVSGNTLAIKDATISQKHLIIHFDSQTAQWILTDLDTSTGTIVNGVRVSNKPIKVCDGDIVRIGESTEIHVTVLVEEVKIGAKRGRKKKDETSEPNLEAGENLKKDDNPVGLSTLDESAEYDGGCESGSVYEPKHALKGKKKNASRVSVGNMTSTATETKFNGRRKQSVKNVDVLDSSFDYIEDKEVSNIEKLADQNVEKVSIKDHTVKTTDHDLPKNVGRGRKRNSARVSKNDTTIEAPISLNRGRKQMCTRGLKKDANMVSGVMDASENILSADELNASFTGNEGVAEVKTKVNKNLTRGKKGRSITIPESSPSEKIESSINERNVSDVTNKSITEDKIATATGRKGRRGRYNKISITEDAVEENVRVSTNVRRGRSGKYNKIPIAEDAVEENAKVSTNLRRGRSSKYTEGFKEGSNLNLAIEEKGENSKDETLEATLKNDVVLVDNTKVQKTKRGAKRTTRSTKVVEENETHSMNPDEDKVTLPKFVRRGRRNNASNLDSIAEDRSTSSMVSDLYEVGEKKPRTRASSRVLKAQVKVKDTILTPVENSYVPEKPIENKIQKVEDETNHAVLTENAGKQNHEGYHVSRKWIENGIPNSTTKYKEDQVISWHGTPFEERVERALSDERFHPKRNTGD